MILSNANSLCVNKRRKKMRNKNLLIIWFILVVAGFAFLGSPQIGAQSGGPTAVVTESCIDEGIICRKHDPTGLPVSSTFYNPATGEYEAGVEAHVWICNGVILVTQDPEFPPTGVECRLRTYSSELFGQTNPSYSCGYWPCSFWP